MIQRDHGFPSWLKPPPTVDELVTDDGEPMESNRHRLQMNLLIDSLDLHWAERPDVFVGGNMFLYFSATQAKKNDFRGPDVFVVLDTERRDRKAWVVWEEEGKLPDVIIELLSESTAEQDRGKKKRIYEKVLKIPHYVLFDPFSAELEAYQIDPQLAEYHRVPPGADGRIPVPRLGLELGVWPGEHRGIEASWLRWYDADGRLIPTAEERAAEASERAAEASERAAEASERAAEAERRSEAERTARERLERELDSLRQRLAAAEDEG